MGTSLDELKNRIKAKIQELITSDQIIEAEELVNQYSNMIPDDSETYSIRTVIKIMQNKFNEAENIIEEGLKLHPYYKDLLFNMSYLKDLKNDYSEAMKYFCMGKLFHSDNTIKVDSIIQNSKPINSNDLNVLQGTIEIANQMNTLSGGLKQLGVNCKTINYYPNYLGFKSDYELNLSSFKDISYANINTKILASEVIGKTDIFHFHFGTTLTLDCSDLLLLKELNKKVIMQYWGSDVRMYSKALNYNPYVKVKDMDEESIKRKLDFLSKHINDCFVDFELAEYVKDYHSNVHLIRVALDINKYKLVGEINNKKPLIVHAPTSPQIKGTEFIIKAINELKEKHDFDFTLVQGMAHEEAKKIYEKADIIIDQILIGSYGLFAVESMALGKPVLCWISDFMKEKYPKELPIISVNPDTIKDKLEYLLRNQDILKEIGRRGRTYVEKYHDSNIVSKNILDIYKSL